MRAAKPRPRDLVAYAVLLGVTLAMGVNRGAIAEPQDRKTPPSMVAIPGGAFTMGSSGEFSRADEQPPHRVRVDSVWMDTTEVTNAAFRRFAEATGYVTTAEKAPNLEEIMAQLPKGSPPPASMLVPGSLVFVMPSKGTPGAWRWKPAMTAAHQYHGHANYTSHILT